MRWVSCLVLMGCGLTLDLTPPVEDGGAADAPNLDAPDIDAGRRDVGFDALPDALPDALRRDVGEACGSNEDCFLPDCSIRECREGMCVTVAGITCAPSDACHALTGTCRRDASCDEILIDEDGDGEASIELGPCGTDCDDGDARVSVGGVCAADLDGDGFGSETDFTVHCGDVMCEDGYVGNRGDCWDAESEGIPSGEPDPFLANPNADVAFFPWPRDDDGGFDWDCDGEVTTQLGDTVFVDCRGTNEPPGACAEQSGWADEVAACGESAAWVACRTSPADGLSCEAVIAPERTQNCR